MPRASDSERFWSRVDKRDDGCWVWTGGKLVLGYGLFAMGGKRMLAHRAIFAIMGNPVPSNVCIDHKCSTTSCVNPDHLRWCSQRENSKNRGASKNNRSGYKGVYWDSRRNRWNAEITVDRKKIYLGCSADARVAYELYWQAAQCLHGEFANPGVTDGTRRATK